jgi:hypothetical protein
MISKILSQGSNSKKSFKNGNLKMLLGTLRQFTVFIALNRYLLIYH